MDWTKDSFGMSHIFVVTAFLLASMPSKQVDDHFELEKKYRMEQDQENRDIIPVQWYSFRLDT